MADGLLGGMQGQGQQQANLLGGVFQSPSATRRQGRDRLFGRALEISQAQDPIAAGGAIGGAQLGLGIGNALGMQTDEQRRANLLEQVQQETLDRDLDPATDPEGTFNFISNRFRELGDPQLALQAQQQKAQYLKEFGPQREFGDFQTYFGPDGTQVEARPVSFSDGRSAIVTAGGQDITGLGFTSEERAENTPIDSKSMPVRFPDGSSGTAYEVPGVIGLQRIVDGQLQPVPRGTTELTSATATPERTVGPTDEDWRNQLSTTQELVDTSSRIQTILEEEGASAIGFLGSTNQFFASVGAQGRALLNDATVFDEETGESLELSLENFQDSIPSALQNAGTAENAQRIKTNALRLAYLVAKSSDPSGRVSDADFKAALRRIGGSTGDPQQFVAALQEETRNAVLSASRDSGNFLENPLSPQQLLTEFSNNNVNTNILQGLDLGQQASRQTPEEVPSAEVIKNNAEETKEVQGKVYYKYNGDWYEEQQ